MICSPIFPSIALLLFLFISNLYKKFYLIKEKKNLEISGLKLNTDTHSFFNIKNNCIKKKIEETCLNPSLPFGRRFNQVSYRWL